MPAEQLTVRRACCNRRILLLICWQLRDEAVQKKGTDCYEMKQLEKANMRFVVSVANQYQKRGLSLDELIEAGIEGLKKAAAKYNFEADFRFIAYAVWWIRQSILQALGEKE